MAQRKRMVRGNFLARIEGAKALRVVPNFLPLGFDQMKWILSAAARHRTLDFARKLKRGQLRNWFNGANFFHDLVKFTVHNQAGENLARKVTAKIQIFKICRFYLD